MTEEPRTDVRDERATLATMLSANAELVVGVLRPGEGTPAVPVLAALSATRNLGNLVDDILHTLARQAREEGHTWAELGDLLGTSRQAAYQRFSGPMPPTGPFPPPPHLPPGPHAHPGDGPRSQVPPTRPGPADFPGSDRPDHPPMPRPPVPPGAPGYPTPPHPTPPGGSSEHFAPPRFPAPPSPPR